MKLPTAAKDDSTGALFGITEEASRGWHLRMSTCHTKLKPFVVQVYEHSVLSNFKERREKVCHLLVEQCPCLSPFARWQMVQSLLPKVEASLREKSDR